LQNFTIKIVQFLSERYVIVKINIIFLNVVQRQGKIAYFHYGAKSVL